MRMGDRYAVFITAVALGALLPRPATTRSLQAAPGDVFGNPNQAVDTYRNRAGAFVLWANGRITKVSGGPADLGHPYSAPPASAQLGAPPAQANQAVGSPNVAVKALTRPDGACLTKVNIKSYLTSGTVHGKFSYNCTEILKTYLTSGIFQAKTRRIWTEHT